MEQLTSADPLPASVPDDRPLDVSGTDVSRSAALTDGRNPSAESLATTVSSTSSCGYPVGLLEPNDTLDEATVYTGDLSGPGYYSRIGCIGDTPNGIYDVDLVLFNLNAGERIFIETDAREAPGLEGPLEPVLRVFDMSGTELAIDQQSYGRRLGSFISFEAPVDGTYAVGVSYNFNTDYDPTMEPSETVLGDSPDPYRLKVWYADLSEPSDTLDQADDFTDALRETGRVDLTGFLGDTDGRLNDADLALFELKAGEGLLLDVQSDFVGKVAPFHTLLRVFDSSGTELAVNANYDAWYSLLSFKAPADGVYAVGVSSYPNFDYDSTIEGSGTDGQGPGIYDLTVRFGDLVEPGDTIDQAEDFTDALRETGSLSLAGIIGDTPRWSDDVDLALFRLGAGEVVHFDVDREGTKFATVDPLLRVFDLAGNELAAYEYDYRGPGLRFESPAAGTYAVGISSDSNPDYDPTRDEGGAPNPWDGGYYRLNATIVSTDIEIGLFDADTDELIALIGDGGEIRLNGAADRNLTIVATVTEYSPLFGFVESMRIDLNDGAVTRTESFGAFSLFGDQRGDFQGGEIPVGDNTVTFDLFSEDGLRGDFLGSISRDFTIVDFDTAVEVGLYDADTDELIALIGDGDEIRLDGAADRNLTIAAIVPPDSPLFDDVESMRIDLNDGAVVNVENLEAYSLFGNTGSDFQGGDIPTGENVVTFDLFSENQLQGDFLGTLTRNFTILDFDVAVEIGLYDADTDELIALIGDGDEIEVEGAAGRNLTIAAIVPEDSPLFDDVDSMRVDLNDGAVVNVESLEAYSLFGNAGNDFEGGDIPLGENVITFDLFSADRLQGDFLGSVTRSFTIVDLDAAPDGAALADASGLSDPVSDLGSVDLPFVDDLV